MKILRTRKAMLSWRTQVRSERTLGFVPTMGALHAGHLSLVKRSKRENDLTVVSIFVNPTQFGPKEDLSKYPRPEREDLRLLREAKVDAVFLPKSAVEIYGRGRAPTSIKPRASLVTMMEGKFRPGHFEGVATVVAKLFHLTGPTRAYFGEKDFQQLKVLEAMVEDLDFNLKIVPCPIYREKSGLAMSSRNRYFQPAVRLAASELFRILKKAKNISQAKKLLLQKGFRVQYLENRSEDLERKLNGPKGRWLVAAYFHGVRLIDNLKR